MVTGAGPHCDLAAVSTSTTANAKIPAVCYRPFWQEVRDSGWTKRMTLDTRPSLGRENASIHLLRTTPMRIARKRGQMTKVRFMPLS